jgi:rRNA maturation endonuclease Nob1
MSLLSLFADVTRAHCDMKGYNSSQASWPEKFQCQGCGHEGPVTIHAECEKCGSAAVQPLSMVGGRS